MLRSENMFCKKCGGLMFPKEGVLVCGACGANQGIKAEDKKTIREHKETKEVAFFDDVDTLPKERILCEKCGNNEAYFVVRQMRAADEPETMIYQCTKCGYKWRR
jgi:DNA-directed RNA polymerase subunit M